MEVKKEASKPERWFVPESRQTIDLQGCPRQLPHAHRDLFLHYCYHFDINKRFEKI